MFMLAMGGLQDFVLNLFSNGWTARHSAKFVFTYKIYVELAIHNIYDHIYETIICGAVYLMIVKCQYGMSRLYK